MRWIGRMENKLKSYDILVAGEINPDLVLTGDVIPAFGQAEQLVNSASFSIGSSSAIFACGAARLGLKVGFIGICGDDLSDISCLMKWPAARWILPQSSSTLPSRPVCP